MSDLPMYNRLPQVTDDQTKSALPTFEIDIDGVAMSYQDGIVKQTEFFTTAELAQKLKMNVQVVTRKVQAGEIRAYKIGKEWRIPEQAVYEWLEERTNQPNTAAASLTPSGPFHQSGEAAGELAARLSLKVSETGTTSIPAVVHQQRHHSSHDDKHEALPKSLGADNRSLPSLHAAGNGNQQGAKTLTIKNQPLAENFEYSRASSRRSGFDQHAAGTNGSGISGGANGTRRFLLEYILAQFEPHRVYQEHEVDLIIRRHGQEAESVKIEMLAALMLTNTAGKFSRRLDYQLASAT